VHESVSIVECLGGDDMQGYRGICLPYASPATAMGLSDIFALMVVVDGRRRRLGLHVP
jgi:hypothetical protein